MIPAYTARMITELITPGTTGFLALCLAGYFLLANALAYTAFAIDKSRAIHCQSRIPERSLLILATLGGWLGAKVAQHRLRHKTRKQPFGIFLNLSVLLLPGLFATALILQSDLTWDKVSSQLTTQTQDLFATSAPAEATTEAPALPRRFGPGSDATAP
ncbi:membrane protein [Cypionkella aquatica]|uniref:Membrane protein n=1 Tax=Cypionkella aquatica TaxID=1756042 RepID=A0AA37WZ46_9RHOB|nr:DUF1294 domain-containing protein [Cypionkella aquatica]GLS86043.1 membrane protein [Cypionkella aquatica]